jgi:hypothetical protein
MPRQTAAADGSGPGPAPASSASCRRPPGPSRSIAASMRSPLPDAVSDAEAEIGTVAHRLIDREFTGKAVLHVG